MSATPRPRQRLSAGSGDGVCRDRSRSIDGYLTRIIEKPGREYYDAAGPRALISMNVWRFDRPHLRCLPRCAAVDARRIRVARSGRAGGRRAASGSAPSAPRGAVLDLSRRSDVALVSDAARRRGGAAVNSIAAHFESLGMTPADAASRAALFAELEQQVAADPRGRAAVAPLHAGPDRDLRQAHRLRRRPLAARRGAARHHARGAQARRRHRPRRRHLRWPGDRSRSVDSRRRAHYRGLQRYVHVVAHRFFLNFPGCELGANIAIASDLPRASGMSSSSALVVGVALALIERAGAARSRPSGSDTCAALPRSGVVSRLRRKRPGLSRACRVRPGSARTAAAKITPRFSRARPITSACIASCRSRRSATRACRRTGRS